MGEKLAVVLFNLGGPSSEAAIRPFLLNFFMDKNIIQLPKLPRMLLAYWIAWTRSRGAAKEAYGRLGGVSPLLANTKAQAAALEKVLPPGAKVFVSMRYWHPFAEETVREVAVFQPDKIVLLPLYPQYSTTTTFSSFENWHAAAKAAGLTVPSVEITSYQADKGFVEASSALIRAELQKAPPQTRLLFSAHGLPEKIIQAGDPYQRHCEETAAAIVRQLGIQDLDWQLCYQSRVGRLKWIGPSTDEALEKAARDKCGVIVYPSAFVSEHVETLVEIDIEYREKAKAAGIPYFEKVPTVGTHPLFIAGLRDLVLSGSQCNDRIKKCMNG